MSFGKYQFLSWARKGFASNIAENDHLGKGAGAAKERQTVRVSIEVNGTPVEKTVALYGPGDVTGIATEMIVRTEPLAGIPDFEPNYLPYVEFYDEDFPWRYTPARPVGQNLRPWLALAVLAEGEFEDTRRRTPLRSILVADGATLPPHDELHLWAHVHSDLSKGVVQTDLDKFLTGLEDDFKKDPDGLFSRIICPRRLRDNTIYHAFLIPVFETGRLAGLGKPFAGVEAQKSAWTAADVNLETPVYHRWSFRTGLNFDFEYAVRLLKPAVMPDELGKRPMDCSAPGFVQADKKQPVSGTQPPLLQLEGALKTPTAVTDPFPVSPESKAFVEQIRKLANLNRGQTAGAEDPVVTIPFYGMHHARSGGNLPVFDPATPAQPNLLLWFNELNRDPRWRAAAGLGVQVVRENQEEFMGQSWDQLKTVLAANEKLRQAQLAACVSGILYQKTVATLPEESVLGFTRAASRKVVAGNATVFQQVRQSLVPEAVFSPAFRRLTRPGGSAARRFAGFDTALISRKINQKTIAAAPDVPFSPLAVLSTQVKLELPATQAQFSAVSVSSNMVVNSPVRSGGGGMPVLTATVLTAGASVNMGDMSAKINQSKVIERFQYDAPLKTKPALTPPAGSSFVAAFNPRTAFIKKIRATVVIPGDAATVGTEFDPVMAYPDLPEPMSTYLITLGKDLLLPNLHLVPPNTLTLMRPNQKFIEAFLTGMNCEMGRELLWREYPTDQRGSYFRQFWDVRGVVAPESGSADREKRKDIVPIHQWKNGPLGVHRPGMTFNPSAAQPTEDTTLILLIRGDLLRKYPGAVVYAHRAVFENGKRRLKPAPVIGADIRFPVYQAEIKPDIKLLGFDLKLSEVVKNTQGAGGQQGWFFIIAEAPGEPRFGMDLAFSPPSDGKLNWNALSWENTNVPTGGFLRKNSLPDAATAKWSQVERSSGKWGESAADMAYVLLQKPAMIATHANEMLKDLKI